VQDKDFVAPPEPQTIDTSEILSDDFDVSSGDESSYEENIQVEERPLPPSTSQPIENSPNAESKTESSTKPSESSTTSSTDHSQTQSSSPMSSSDVRRTLGFGALFFITINAIFGSSLTYLPGLGMQMAGPSSILMWVAVFLIGTYIAVSLSELVSLFPEKGNIYKFARNAFGHFTGFLVGWTSWFTGNIVASLSIVWALEYLFPVAGTMP
jgi:amino acid permease